MSIASASHSTAVFGKPDGINNIVIFEGDRTNRFRLVGRDGSSSVHLADDVFRKTNERNREKIQKAVAVELSTVCQKINTWTSQNQNSISDCEIIQRESPTQHIRLRFVVTQKGRKYNQKLSNGLISLDLDLATDPKLTFIRVDTVIVPNVSEKDIEDITSKWLTK